VINITKHKQKAAILLAISIALTTAILGCTKEESSTSNAPVISENNIDQHVVEPNTEPLEPESEEPLEEDTQSLEQVSEKDAAIYLDALKKQDTSMLSLLMAPAENEYTVADMEKVVEGFQLYFDDLEGLQLHFEASEQNEEYYIEHYIIKGTKDGEVRDLPFQVSYIKSQGIELILDDDKREPLFNSPMIGVYPYAILNVERYVQALQQQDKESLALHLGMYDDNEQTRMAIDQLLQTYQESLALSTVEIISKDYDEQKDLFLFELQDNNQQSHELQVLSEELRIKDEWVNYKTL